MKLIIDAMGGDHAPGEIIKGAVDGLLAFPGFELLLTGPKEVLEKELAQYNYPKERVEIIHAPDLISMDEHPVAAIKQKKNSSLVVGLELLKSKKGDAFITAGSTGATLAGALLRVGRIKGIQRPGLTPVLPNKGKGAVLIDCGANMDCKPVNLAQFAIMGSIYAQHILGVETPRVGLASVGTEDEKGNELTKAAFTLIKEQNAVNFSGNIEGRDIVDKVDVVVADGFAGNLILKSIEGVGAFIFSSLKEAIGSSFRNKIGALLMKPALRKLKNTLDYTTYGGAPLLGIDGIVIKAHGSSKAKSMFYTIKQAIAMVDADIVEVIRKNIPEEKTQD